MKKTIYIYFMSLTMAVGCDNSKTTNLPKEEKADTTAATIVATDSQSSNSTQLPTSAKSFVLPNHDVLKFQKGDLNKDNIEDIVLVLEQKDGDDMAARPLLLLLQDAKGVYTLAARNDKVVACKGCGGMMGDPLAGIAIKNGFFTIEEEGGSRERWTRYITFQYDAAQKTWVLHRIDETMVDTLEPKNDTKSVKTAKNFGKILFAQYDSEKME
jgi:hypothetical protein